MRVLEARRAEGAAGGGRARGKATPAARGARAVPGSAELAVQALQLLGRWQRVCNGHLSFTSGCGCGYGAAIDLRDFDDIILDYLLNRFSDAPAVADYVNARAHLVAGNPGSLKALLRAVAAAPAEVPQGQAHALLLALEASIASIEEQHAM